MNNFFGTRFVVVFALAVVFGAGHLHAQAPINLLGFTNSWRYNQTTSYDGVNWTAPGFDDSALPSGRGVFGNESGNTFVTSRTNTVLALGRVTYYFRTRFTFTNDPAEVSLTFSNIIDDGAVYYLNGVEIARFSMPSDTAPVTYATLASNHEATAVDVFTVSGRRVETNLVQGDNVLAVEVHQTTAGSSDIVFGLAVTASFPEYTPPPLRMPLNPPQFGYTVVNAFPGLNFNGPVAIATPPGETNQIFVVSKAGRIYAVTNLASPNLTTFLDISGKVYNSGESGLLGLAFHPGYATNRLFFVYYSFQQNGLYQGVSRFQTSPSNRFFAPTNTEVRLFAQADPASNHNGGDLHFGPDGLLYISLGDGGVQNDGDQNSQRIDKAFFAVILRIDADDPPRPDSIQPNGHPANTNWGPFRYRIPADNPFIGRTNYDGIAVDPNRVITEIYAVGFRNPWRMSFDPLTDHLYVADVGQGAWEEVSVVRKGGNYGWAYREGLHPGFKAGTPREVLTDPIQEYAHGSGPMQGNSITGGRVYRGARFPQLYGAYVFGDYASGNIWMLRYDGTNTIPFQRIASRPGVSAFGVDPANGDLLLTDVAGGGVHRLVYDTNNVSGALPPTLADTGAFSGLGSLTNSTQPLTASSGMLPYELNVPFWSDHARKSRWFLSATNLKIGFAPEGNWSLPSGMAWVKHFDLELTNGVPSSARRLETRLLVKNSNGVYGVTYRWGNSLTNATLVPDDGMDEQFTIVDGGTTRTQVWRYPSRTECIVCHTPTGGFALGFNTVQLNRDFAQGNSLTNQLAALSAAGHFTAPITNINALRALAPASDAGSSLEWRVRSYLSANCAQCHQGGSGPGVGSWMANISTPTGNAGLINGALNNSGGNTNARVVVPGSLTNSMLLTRISTRGPGQMPPLGSTVVDSGAVALLSAWITNDLAAGWSNTTAPVTLTANATNGGAAVSFTQPANRAYRLESATSLSTPPSWRFVDEPENRPSYPSTNIPRRIVEETNATQKFYRLQITTP